MSQNLYKQRTEFEQPIDITRCRCSIHSPTGFHQCLNKVKVTRDGIGYCGQHDPERVKPKRPPTKFAIKMMVCDLNEQAHKIVRAMIRTRSSDHALRRQLKRYETLAAKVKAATDERRKRK